MSAASWTAAGIAVVVIMVCALWAAVDAARPESRPPAPLRTVFALVATIALMLALGLLVNLLRLVHTPVGWLGARLEHLLRRLAASGDDSEDEVVIHDDHGHPYDPENTPWNDDWSTK